jgi:DNA-binding transcriptional regulator YdaS (Cro superfamily)
VEETVVKQLLRVDDADLIEAASQVAGSDYELARKLGVTRRAVQRWQNGTNPVPASVWPEIAQLMSEQIREMAQDIETLHRLAALAEEMRQAMLQRRLLGGVTETEGAK